MSIIISAIICTHNRAEYLTQAIQSLVDQRIPKDKYEIIVVDNCSTDSTKEVVRRFSRKCNLRYLYEPTLGANYARNAGWRNARGKYVAYLDDDTVACHIWLDKILEVFETVTPRPGCIGGRVEPIWEIARPKWLSDWLLHGLAIINWSETPRVLPNISVEWLVSANIAFPVEVLERFGGFHLGLGRLGKNLLSGDEILLEKQILKAGYSCFFHPEIAVKHHIPKSRLKKDWFIRRYFWQGVTDATMQLLEESPSTTKRIFIAISKTLGLILTPRKLVNLIMPVNDPERFTNKCLALITVGHISGLLGSHTKSRRLKNDSP